MKLFTYGSLKSGYWNNHYLKDCPYLSDGVSYEKYMIYYESYPFAVHKDNEEESSLCLPVHGELYEVDRHTLSILDILETGYERKTRPIITSEGIVQAFVYEWPTPRPYGITQTCVPNNNSYEWKEE